MFKLNILQIKLYSRKMYMFPYHIDNVMVPFRNGQLTSLKMICIGLLATCKEKPSDHKFPKQKCAKSCAFTEELKMLYH